MFPFSSSGNVSFRPQPKYFLVNEIPEKIKKLFEMCQKRVIPYLANNWKRLWKIHPENPSTLLIDDLDACWWGAGLTNDVLIHFNPNSLIAVKWKKVWILLFALLATPTSPNHHQNDSRIEKQGDEANRINFPSFFHAELNGESKREEEIKMSGNDVNREKLINENESSQLEKEWMRRI